MALTGFTVSAFAADDVPHSIRADVYSLTLDAGETYSLEITYYPDKEYSGLTLKGSSSNEDVASIDSSGVIYTYAPGQCTLTLEVKNGPSTKVHLIVRGNSSTYYSTSSTGSIETDGERYRIRSSSSSSSSSSGIASSKSSATASSSKSISDTTIKLTEKATREDVITAAKTGVVLENYASVSAESLSAAANSGGASVTFDTKSGKTVVGRLVASTANAKNLTGDISTGVYCDTGNTKKVQNKFDKNFNQNVKVILCDQKNFGINVEIVAKAGNLSTDNLHFYSFDSATNSYAPITASNVWKDSNNYLHFTTSTGGYIVASDGAL